MRRYAVLDLQADHHLNADLKDQGGIERRLKKKNPAHTRPGRQTPADSRGTSFFLTAGRKGLELGYASAPSPPQYRRSKPGGPAAETACRRENTRAEGTPGAHRKR